MHLTCVLILALDILTAISAKNYSATEANRLRIKTLYQANLLTRPPIKNTTQTVVAVGLGIVEVTGIDPRTQVGTDQTCAY